MAIIKKYRSETVSIQNFAENIITALFRSAEKSYSFKPGQYLHLAIDGYNLSLPWPDSRYFSMQSSPSARDIKITFSIKGAFTKRMAEELKPGRILYLKLPYGNFLSKLNTIENCVFISGGTGITPFLSLFTDKQFGSYKIQDCILA